LTVSLNVPAATGGTVVDLAGTGPLSVSATVTVPAGALSVDFDVTADATAGAGDVTASLGSSSDVSTVTVVDLLVGSGTFISQVIEGSSGTNKIVEIYNSDVTPADLSLCQIRGYSNGKTAHDSSIQLDSVTLSTGDTWVVCHTSTSIDAGACEQTSGSLNFNGDDVIELICDGTVMDIFGKIGEDPGSDWSGGGLSTKDSNLIRSCTVTAGDVDGSDDFDPSVEWVDGGTDDPADLGAHSCP